MIAPGGPPSWSGMSPEPSGFHADAYHVHPVTGVPSGHHVAEAVAHSSGRQVRAPRDLPARGALGQQPDHVQLPVGDTRLVRDSTSGRSLFASSIASLSVSTSSTAPRVSHRRSAGGGPPGRFWRGSTTPPVASRRRVGSWSGPVRAREYSWRSGWVLGESGIPAGIHITAGIPLRAVPPGAEGNGGEANPPPGLPGPSAGSRSGRPLSLGVEVRRQGPSHLDLSTGSPISCGRSRRGPGSPTRRGLVVGGRARTSLPRCGYRVRRA